ncbi:MAG: protoporphyrinogen oxidase [Lacipirellulaceae bacterium]
MPSPRVAIIGGGISGLTAAFQLHRQMPTATLRLYEASSRLGGALSSLPREDFLIEQGADSFITKTPDALELCRQLGVESRLIPTNEKHRRALIVHNGQLVPVPAGFVLMRAMSEEAVLASPILSDAGKQRFLEEKHVPPHPNCNEPDHDESVAGFAIRRLGQEVYDRLVQPLMGGIYVADAHRLSLRATMPDFLEAERKYGSLYASVQAQAEIQTEETGASGARYSAFLSFPNGMSEFIEALTASLPEGTILLNQPVTSIHRADSRWQVATIESEMPVAFDAVVLATPAHVSSQLLSPLDAQLGEELRRIKSASSIVVSCAYPLDQIGRELDGFGFVIPEREGRKILAGSFLSVKFPGRAPEEVALMRAFVGGMLQSKLVELADQPLLELVKSEIAELLGVQGEPLTVDIARWQSAMPQYEVGHLDLVEEIEHLTAEHQGLALAGNAYRGVGIPHCVASGKRAAKAVLNSLDG